MIDSISFLSFLSLTQWIVAFLFVPLVCWHEWSRSALFCRWCALLTGYTIQIGLIVLLLDSGFNVQTVILIGSISAYAWIKLMTGWLPTERKVRASQQ